jgi:branched-subunit amino acid transport protein
MIMKNIYGLFSCICPRASFFKLADKVKVTNFWYPSLRFHPETMFSMFLNWAILQIN